MPSKTAQKIGRWVSTITPIFKKLSYAVGIRIKFFYAFQVFFICSGLESVLAWRENTYQKKFKNSFTRLH